MRPNTLWKWSLGVVLLASAVTWAQEEVPASSALARMPVRELTVFKDGHAFVMHQGKMPTNEAGEVLMDYLPAPVLGTFWPYAAEKGVKLASVTAGQRRVTVARQRRGPEPMAARKLHCISNMMTKYCKSVRATTASTRA